MKGLRFSHGIKIRALGLVLALSLGLFACTPTSEPATSLPAEPENSLSPSPEESLLVQEEVKNGVVHWLVPAAEADLTTIRFGIVQDRMGGESKEEYTALQQTLNTYLHDQGWQVELHIWIPVEEGESGPALAACMQESMDLVYALTTWNQMRSYEWLDLSEGEARSTLSAIFDFLPQRYWEYMQTQMNGVLALVGNLSLHGALSFSVVADAETGQGFSEEEVKSLIGGNWEAWHNVFQAVQPSATQKALSVESVELRFLSLLGPETQGQSIAPGVILDFESGRAVNVFQLEAVSQHIARYQKWIDEGLVRENEDAVFAGFTEGGGKAAAERREYTTARGTSARWSFSVQDGALWYPASIDNTPLFYTAIPRGAAHSAEALQLLKKLGEDAELRSQVYRQVFMAYLIPARSYELAASDEITWYQDSGEAVPYNAVVWDSFQKAQIPSLAGFVFNGEPVAAEIEALEQVAARSERASRFVGSGYSNQSWADDLAALQVDLEEAGIERVIEEANRQIAEWKGTS